jgi:hypothetical protein
MASKIKVDQIQTADGTGTIALQNQLSGMTGASMPTGSVLQVVSQSSSILETSSTSYVDMYSVTITPSSTSSKILVMVTNHIYVTAWSTNDFRGAFVKVLRGTTSIHEDVGYGESSVFEHDSDRYMTYSTFQLLDSPNTTSATTYKVQGASRVSDVIVFNNTNYGAGGAITLMEIAG